MSELTATGGCLCGAVKYQVRGPLRPVTYCHCGQCRRTSGHFVAATASALEHFDLLDDSQLRWYQSSASAQRGFCQICGSSLLWKPAHGRHISIMAGSLDMPSGLTAQSHIFVGQAGDYYHIGDGLPQCTDGDTDLRIDRVDAR